MSLSTLSRTAPAGTGATKRMIAASHPQKYILAQDGTSMEDKIRTAVVVVSDAVERYYPDLAIAMSWGKDSVAMLGVLRIAYPELPVGLLFTDTRRKFLETYAHMLKVQEEMGPVETMTYMPDIPLLNCDQCRAWKTIAAVDAPKHFGVKALLVGIRADEHEARAAAGTGRVIDGVARFHPILSWTEADVWEFTRRRGLPVHPLYAEGYRSLGCEDPCTVRTPEGALERGGRAQDKEAIMATLRGQGYW